MCHCKPHINLLFKLLPALFSSSPERKRRVSSRVTGKREPSPAPARLSSLRHSTPLKQPPQLLNGKTDASAAGRTRSAARHSAHSPPASSSAAHTTSNAPSTAGETTVTRRTDVSRVTNVHETFPCSSSESSRSLRGHNSVSSSTPPAAERMTPSPAVESVSGGSTRRKLRTPVRHTPGRRRRQDAVTASVTAASFNTSLYALSIRVPPQGRLPALPLKVPST